MTALRAGTVPTIWQQLVPAGRTYVTLPNPANPVVVADASRPVLNYARHALLATPPGARMPSWTWEAARHALGSPGLWRLAPRVSVPAAATTEFSNWLREADYRVALLDHSNDPDKRVIALLFAANASAPSLAVKVAPEPAGAQRLRAERERIRELHELGVAAVRRCAPRLAELPVANPVDSAATSGELLATTAARGTPMFVTYHRGAHTRTHRHVLADFTAAASWLAELHELRTGPARPLDVAAGIEATLGSYLDDSDAFAARRALGELRRRLRRYQVADRVVHGDFWPGNLLVEHGVICGVVDWERWCPAGNPVRDLARFAASYSLYLDRRTRPGRPVGGHSGLRAGDARGGIGYALDGVGWYPRLVRGYLREGLERLGLPADIGRDVVLAEVAANAAESTSPEFGSALWRTFIALSEAET
jgi:aminoglycoside phosphotransferase